MRISKNKGFEVAVIAACLRRVGMGHLPTVIDDHEGGDETGTHVTGKTDTDRSYDARFRYIFLEWADVWLRDYTNPPAPRVPEWHLRCKYSLKDGIVVELVGDTIGETPQGVKAIGASFGEDPKGA